jgi:hypothetical protein
MSSIINGTSFQLGGTTFHDGSKGLQVPLDQLKNYSPSIVPGLGLSGTSANQAKFIDLGCVRMCWGNVSLSWTNLLTKSNNITIPLPNGLFTEIQSCQLTVQNQFGNPDLMCVLSKGVNSSAITCMLFTSNGGFQITGNVSMISWFVIGR